MSRFERKRQLRWLMTLRVVIVTTLLVSAFGIELLLRPAYTLQPLFTLAAASYGMVLLYAALERRLRDATPFVVLQLVGDAVLITSFVGITGGIESPLSFLYLLPISAASMMLFRRGGVALALVSWALYGAMVAFGPAFSLVGSGIVAAPGRVTYFLVGHLVAMIAFALLTSYLSESLRSQGRELDERRGAVARLKALNENIIESINSGLITTNLGGQINFMNRGGAEILRFKPREVESQPIDELFPLGEGFLDQIRLRLVADQRFRFERDFRTKVGEKIFLGIAVSNLHDKVGRPLGYIFIFQDLTEIRALEQEMRLKERIVALGEMAAGMAHELRNPLAAISGSVQYLKGAVPQDGETSELMDIILRESQRLDQAIRDFLTFARPGSFAPEFTDVVRLIEDNVKLLRKSASFETGHRVETDYAAPRIECEIDTNRVKQVFWNLATNALKAMPDGGTLTIRVAELDDGENVEVRFTDDGVGMDEVQQQLYFQPFNSSFREGTGLGAAIVFRLIEEHGGRIFVDSSPGRGTSVSVSLPRFCGSVEVTPEMQLQVAGGQ